MLRRTQSKFQIFICQFDLKITRLLSQKQNTTKHTLKLNQAYEINQYHPHDRPITVNFLTSAIGSSTYRWTKVLQEYPQLKTVKRKDLLKSVESLKNFQFTNEDIYAKPMILYNNALTIENRYSVLKECGFQTISVGLLSRYLSIVNKPVTLLKNYGYLPYELNMLQQLQSLFTDVEVNVPDNNALISEDCELKIIRQQILNCYLQKRLDMTSSDIDKLWRIYSRVRHRNFQSVQKMVDILIKEFQFPKERIVKNGFLLYGEPENVMRILKYIPTIDGKDIREIAYRRPKILMSSCECLEKTLEHIRYFGIGENAVLRCIEVLTLGSDTVLERLRDLNEIDEFKVLATNPRILRLIHYQNKARLRLEYLNQLKVRCASLHILSCGSETFAKFAREGSDHTKGRDIVVYLANIMQKDENSIRSILSRHPNWCHIPVLHIKQCYDHLRKKKFPIDAIYNNVHILLYPINYIEDKLFQLQSPDFLDNIEKNMTIDQLTNDEILTMILYLIESEYHFTGDGVWTEQHTVNVENFNNLLPDFPESVNKVYRYGVKPASHRN